MIHTFVDVLPNQQERRTLSYFCKRLTALSQFATIYVTDQGYSQTSHGWLMVLGREAPKQVVTTQIGVCS